MGQYDYLLTDLTDYEKWLLGQKPSGLSQEDRAVRRRLQNKIAAQGSRFRKRRHASELESITSMLYNRLDDSAQTVVHLRQQVNELILMVQQHRDLFTTSQTTTTTLISNHNDTSTTDENTTMTTSSLPTSSDSSNNHLFTTITTTNTSPSTQQQQPQPQQFSYDLESEALVSSVVPLQEMGLPPALLTNIDVVAGTTRLPYITTACFPSWESVNNFAFDGSDSETPPPSTLVTQQPDHYDNPSVSPAATSSSRFAMSSRNKSLSSSSHSSSASSSFISSSPSSSVDHPSTSAETSDNPSTATTGVPRLTRRQLALRQAREAQEAIERTPTHPRFNSPHDLPSLTASVSTPFSHTPINSPVNDNNTFSSFAHSQEDQNDPFMPSTMTVQHDETTIASPQKPLALVSSPFSPDLVASITQTVPGSVTVPSVPPLIMPIVTTPPFVTEMAPKAPKTTSSYDFVSLRDPVDLQAPLTTALPTLLPTEAAASLADSVGIHSHLLSGNVPNSSNSCCPHDIVSPGAPIAGHAVPCTCGVPSACPSCPSSNFLPDSPVLHAHTFLSNGQSTPMFAAAGSPALGYTSSELFLPDPLGFLI